MSEELVPSVEDEQGGVNTMLSVAADTGDPDTYIVGNHENGTAYKVNLAALRGVDVRACTCPDDKYRPSDDQHSVCKHVLEAIAAAPRAATVDAMAAIRLREELDILKEANRALVETVTDAPASAETATDTADADAGGDESITPEEAAEMVTDATPHLETETNGGYVWLQTTFDAPDDAFGQLLQDPEQIKYVHDGHDDADLKPGEWFKNRLDPADAEEYVEEVLG